MFIQKPNTQMHQGKNVHTNKSVLVANSSRREITILYPEWATEQRAFSFFHGALYHIDK
jgi:hypothetical protein